jgi:glycosyltransferase involved in cell wall biosynthesis
MEAHAGGAAVISSGTGGLSEISQDSALILNSVTMESISGAIKSLIMDEGLRINLSKRGMLRVNNNFNIQYIAQEYDHFVSRIFNDNKKRLYK